jgi:hypothetical protein
MKEVHRAEVFAMAVVVRAAFADMAALGRAVPDQALAALALVERWQGGAPVDAAAFQAATDLAHQEGLRYEQREKDRALSWARCAAGNLAWMAKKERGWEKCAIVDNASYSLSSLGVAGVKDAAQLEAMRKAALKSARKSTPATPAPRPERVDLSEFIGAAAQKRLAKRKPVFEAASRGTEAQLRALLKQRGYAAHDAVLAFDARYGGLVFADSPGEEGYDWLLGAFAYLKSNAHVDPRGSKPDHVPVAYSPNDRIFYLDKKGACWAIDTIEDTKAVRYASDGDTMVKRILNEE